LKKPPSILEGLSKAFKRSLKGLYKACKGLYKAFKGLLKAFKWIFKALLKVPDTHVSFVCQMLRESPAMLPFFGAEGFSHAFERPLKGR
jgi:hypothetical protein